MKAIVLAAGRGSRLQGLTDNKPKCLQKIGPKTILEWQMSVLRSCGVSEITIVTGYRSEMLSGFGLETIYNPDWEETNMVRSLLCANSKFTEPVIVSYSDILYSPHAVKILMERKEDAVIIYDLEWKELWSKRFKNPLDDAESFKIGKDDRIKEIGEKAESIDKIEGQYVGLMRFTPLAFSWIIDYVNKQNKAVVDKLDMTALIRGLIASGRPVYGAAIKGGWCEIDIAQDLVLANAGYREGSLFFGNERIS